MSENDLWLNATGPSRIDLLRPSGTITINRAGTTVENVVIAGCLNIRASDVVVRNVIIRCDRAGAGPNVVDIADGTTGAILEDVEIDGLGRTENGIGWANYTLRRAAVHGVSDGARLGSRVRIEASFFYGITSQGGLHSDAMQSTSGTDISIVGNRIIGGTQSADTNNNAAIMLGTELGTRWLDQVVISGNYLDGGGCTINIRGDIRSGRISIERNVFGPSSRWGAIIAPLSVAFSGTNVYEQDGRTPAVLPAL